MTRMTTAALPLLRDEVREYAASPLAIATHAVDALIAEARLTPKPALVDKRGSGVHRDLDLDTMLRSASALQPTFLAIARAASNAGPSQALREQLARIGREGEAAMIRATNGSNAHRGAIWIVGLMCAGAAMHAPHDGEAICATAGHNRAIRRSLRVGIGRQQSRRTGQRTLSRGRRARRGARRLSARAAHRPSRPRCRARTRAR